MNRREFILRGLQVASILPVAAVAGGVKLAAGGTKLPEIVQRSYGDMFTAEIWNEVVDRVNLLTAHLTNT